MQFDKKKLFIKIVFFLNFLFKATTSNIVALPSNLLVNIRPTSGVQNQQKPSVGPQRVVFNQQVVRPQNNTVRRLPVAPLIDH